MANVRQGVFSFYENDVLSCLYPIYPTFRFIAVDTKVIHLPAEVGLAHPELSVSPAR